MASPFILETFDKEFKVSKKDEVELPAPIHCSIIFTDLESLAPLKQLVEEQQIRITGQSFIEVKLNRWKNWRSAASRWCCPFSSMSRYRCSSSPTVPYMLAAAKQMHRYDFAIPPPPRLFPWPRNTWPSSHRNTRSRPWRKAPSISIYCEYTLRESSDPGHREIRTIRHRFRGERRRKDS